MEELQTNPDLHALEELMTEQRWNEASFDSDFDDDEILSSAEMEAVYRIGIPNI